MLQLLFSQQRLPGNLSLLQGNIWYSISERGSGSVDSGKWMPCILLCTLKPSKVSL